MSERTLNRPVLEKICKDIFRMEDPEQIRAFVCMIAYTLLID